MTIFLDTSALIGIADRDDRWHEAATGMLATDEPKLTTDHVLIEFWRWARAGFGQPTADQLVGGLVDGAAQIESVGVGDLQRALEIGEEYPDQPFSLVDRTSFAVMRRLGISRVATFDHHFAVYRFGPGRRRAFEIVR